MVSSVAHCYYCGAEFRDGEFITPHLETCPYFSKKNKNMPASVKNKDKKGIFLEIWDGDDPEAEYHFMRNGILGHPPGIRERARLLDVKDWRFDFAWPGEKVAVEIDGNAWGVKGGGRHMGDDDLRKLNFAKIMGWVVFRFSPRMIEKRSKECRNMVARAIKLRKDGEL